MKQAARALGRLAAGVALVGALVACEPEVAPECAALRAEVCAVCGDANAFCVETAQGIRAEGARCQATLDALRARLEDATVEQRQAYCETLTRGAASLE